jgi:transcription elongation factor Elf1
VSTPPVSFKCGRCGKYTEVVLEEKAAQFVDTDVRETVRLCKDCHQHAAVENKQAERRQSWRKQT